MMPGPIVAPETALPKGPLPPGFKALGALAAALVRAAVALRGCQHES